jgi:hypothetical protein
LAPLTSLFSSVSAIAAERARFAFIVEGHEHEVGADVGHVPVSSSSD